MSEEVPNKKMKAGAAEKELVFYELDDSSFKKPTWSFSINCPESDCERHFTMSLSPHTNLVLIVADKNKTCPCQDSPISVKPIKVDYGSDVKRDFCNKMNSTSYRVGVHPS